jgi:hypothetical protein
MFPRERKFRSARADSIRFTNALTVPKCSSVHGKNNFSVESNTGIASHPEVDNYSHFVYVKTRLGNHASGLSKCGFQYSI